MLTGTSSNAPDGPGTAKDLYATFLRDVKEGRSSLAVHFNAALTECKWGAVRLEVPLRGASGDFDHRAVETFGRYRLALLGYMYTTVFFMNLELDGEVCFSIEWEQTKQRLLMGEARVRHQPLPDIQ